MFTNENIISEFKDIAFQLNDPQDIKNVFSDSSLFIVKNKLFLIKSDNEQNSNAQFNIQMYDYEYLNKKYLIGTSEYKDNNYCQYIPILLMFEQNCLLQDNMNSNDETTLLSVASLHNFSINNIYYINDQKIIRDNCFSLNGTLLVASNNTNSIQPGISAIGAGAFALSKIRQINIPNEVRNIDDNAFYLCTNLINISLPEHIDKIKNQTFQNCINLQRIVIPKKVRIIGFESFSNCYNLTEVDMKDSNVNIIEDFAFYNCKKLESIKLPNTVRNISSGSFDGCVNLKEIDLPKKVKTIPNFINCNNLTKIIIRNETEVLDFMHLNLSNFKLKFFVPDIIFNQYVKNSSDLQQSKNIKYMFYPISQLSQF